MTSLDRPAPEPTFHSLTRTEIAGLTRDVAQRFEAILAIPGDFTARYERLDRLWVKATTVERVALRELMLLRLAGGVVS